LKKRKLGKPITEIDFDEWVKATNPSKDDINAKLGLELWDRIDDDNATYDKWIDNDCPPRTATGYPIYK
jgi:hypothetical protein